MVDRPSEKKKRYIRRRDGNKCQKCGEEEDLHVHHIEPISEGGDNDNLNLITVCADCHRAIHHKNVNSPTVERNTTDPVDQAKLFIIAAGIANTLLGGLYSAYMNISFVRSASYFLIFQFLLGFSVVSVVYKLKE
jgi:transcriptional regulator NrdR family protein